MKLKSMMTALTALALMASPVRASDTKTEAIKAGGATVAGAAVGYGAVTAAGPVGAGIGALVGLAGYGIYRIFKH